MSETLTAVLLTIPIIATATYVLRYHRRGFIILTGEGFLYCTAVYGYLWLTLTLVPRTAPTTLKVLATISILTVAVSVAPVTARRISRRLEATSQLPKEPAARNRG